MTNRTASATRLAAMAISLGLLASGAQAQVTCTPTYGGGYRTTDTNGNTSTTTPTYVGGTRTTDNNGSMVTCTPAFGGGKRCYQARWCQIARGLASPPLRG